MRIRYILVQDFALYLRLYTTNYPLTHVDFHYMDHTRRIYVHSDQNKIAGLMYQF